MCSPSKILQIVANTNPSEGCIITPHSLASKLVSRLVGGRLIVIEFVDSRISKEDVDAAFQAEIESAVDTVTEKPFTATLWTDCLFEWVEALRDRGESTVQFSEVDELVIKKSKAIENYSMPDNSES